MGKVFETFDGLCILDITLCSPSEGGEGNIFSSMCEHPKTIKIKHTEKLLKTLTI